MQRMADPDELPGVVMGQPIIVRGGAVCL